ncbi:MAG: hypothetical protein JJU41_05825 [Bacteroidetes bacterium]|nr:hypothetical protein [Bacteroidota bacterium]
MQYGWFLIYYFVLMVFCIWYGTGFIRQPGIPAAYLITSAASSSPPRLLLKILRYALMFTFISAVLSIYPLALSELLFSVVMLGLIFAAGRLLLMWDSVRGALQQKEQSLRRMMVKTGWLLSGVGMVSLILWFRIISGTN